MPKLKSVTLLRKKVDELTTLAEQVQEDIEAQRSLNEDKSERWQESEAAAEWEAYLDEAEDLISNIQSLTL